MVFLRMLINICICTYKRPKLLQLCLASLQNMKRPDTIKFAVTVVDNDGDKTAQAVVSDFRGSVDFDIIYQVEEKRGIPCARNRALNLTLEMLADAIVFIDDDETVRHDWLIELMKASRSYGHTAVVHGLVVPKLSDTVPYSVAGLFKPKSRADGQLLNACATDNVIVPMALITKYSLRFDESQPLAGGTDTIFFTLACQKGVKIYQANKAVVDEFIPESRSNLKWFIRRKFRSGLTDAWRKLQRGRLKPLVVASALFHIIFYSFKSFFFLVLMSGLRRNECFLKVAKYSGIFMGCFNLKIDSYKSIDQQ